MTKQKTIVATNATLKLIVHAEIRRLGDNADLNHIDVSQVTNMRGLFAYSKSNCDISKWDVRNVTNMYEAFYHSKFNRDISRWDVSKVANMSWMFAFSKFTAIEHIEKWGLDPAKVNTSDMFKGTGLENSSLAQSLNS